jgi:hypothetical protein
VLIEDPQVTPSDVPATARRSWGLWTRGRNEASITEEETNDVTQSRTQPRHKEGHRMSQSASWVGPY